MSKLAGMVAAIGLATGASRSMEAQAVSTARQALQLSVFAGATGVYTGLGGGRNASLSAGVDLEIRPLFGLSPAVEVRGMYPVDRGGVDSQETVLGGLRVGRRFGQLEPYMDFLYGRGQIIYSPAYPDPAGTFFYLQTPSNVLSPGIGVDYELSRHFGMRADVQYQRYRTPVTTSGTLYAKPITLGLVYRFDFNRAAGLPNR